MSSEYPKQILPALPFELWDEILGYCEVEQLLRLGSTSCAYATLTRNYLKSKMDLNIGRFFSDVEAFHEMLRSCDAIVSGSVALHILLPSNYTTWMPADLDIYVPFVHFHYLTVLLGNKGYHLIQEGQTNLNPYSFTSIRTVATFDNGHQRIDVIVSKTAAAVCPVLQFHSTTVMNFFGPDHIFCAYPTLTLNWLAKINPGPLYFNRFRYRTIEALWKYAQCGFRYTS